jgi:type III pantothenate kinase
MIRLAEALTEVAAQVTSAWAVNVGGRDVEDKLRELLRDKFGIELQLALTQPEFGAVINGYRSFEQLGADRWAAIIGAWEACRERVCVVDAGTAVTIDLVEADGRHRGGIILPGLQLMVAALNRDTSDIEGFANSSRGPVEGDDWFGLDTLSAVQRGARFALRAAINSAAGANGDEPLRLVITGGDAAKLLPLGGREVEHRPALVLEGLGYIADASVGVES